MGGWCSRDFLWGTAMAGHQVEGDNCHADWWHFEQRRGLARSGRACDFLHRFEADLDRARALGTNAIRLSLEWSRVEPRRGERDPDAVAFYDRLVDACSQRQLRPMLSLVHFTLPQWAMANGLGWADPELLPAFGRHVAWLAERYGDRVDCFATVNEPSAQAAAAFFGGVFPPGRRGRFDLAERCERGLLAAHALAYHTVHETLARRHPSQRPMVGPVQHLVAWRRSRLDPFGVFFAAASAFNWRFLDAIHEGVWPGRLRKQPMPEAYRSADFIGINYYTAAEANPLWMGRLSWMLPPARGPELSDMGLPIAPDGLEDVLYQCHIRYRRPIIIAENGIADASDSQRPRYLTEHIAAMRRAMSRGADVRGYLHWSLLDNFEWHHGFWPRFGLFAVDYDSLERTPRPSAEVYRRLIAEARGDSST